MAVTMIVEDGSIVDGANSYVSLAYSNTYLERNIHSFSTWENLDDSDKSALLVWASGIIDNYFNLTGLKMDGDAVLRWPRTGVYDLDGYLIGDDEIPEALMQSVCELALHNALSDSTTDPDTSGISELVVDVIEIKFDKYDRPLSIPQKVRQLMRTLGVYVGPSPGAVRFARVLRT